MHDLPPLWLLILVAISGFANVAWLAMQLTVGLWKSDDPELQEYLDEHFPDSRHDDN